MASGHMDLALRSQREALGISRELLAEQPSEPRYVQGLASLLYGMGSTLTAVGEVEQAIATLNECEELYQQLPGSDAYQADVVARRGLAESARGFGASAVLELDDAADRYIRLDAGEDSSPRYLDLARILAVSATVLHKYADPDLAAVAADQAIRMYLQRAEEINTGPAVARHSVYFMHATEVASEAHAAHGRLDLARQVDEMAVHAATVTGDPARLAAALAREWAHSDNTHSDTEASVLEKARQLDAEAAERALTRAAGPHPMTFAQALDLAGSDTPIMASLMDLLFDPRRPDKLPMPSGRCGGDPRQAALLGGVLSDHARRMLDTNPQAGRRLGLESHFLLAIASRGRDVNMRFNFGHAGVQWAAVVLATLRSFADIGDTSMQADLNNWLRGIVLQLQPHAFTDQAAAAIIAECDAYWSGQLGAGEAGGT